MGEVLNGQKLAPRSPRVSENSLLLDCMQGSRKDSFAKGVIAQLKEKDRFLALIEQYLEGEKGAHQHDHHDHRSLEEVRARIDALGLGATVQVDAYGVYDILAAAEAKAHGVPIDEIHFHEVGNTEATIWIAVSCLVMRQLIAERGITQIIGTPVCTGYGYVDCAHGRLPIPAPATVNILVDVPAFPGEIEGELTTPTGAALVVYYAQRFLASGEEAAAFYSTRDADTIICMVGA